MVPAAAAATDEGVHLSPRSAACGDGDARLKILCCFGGRIASRPSDGSLKYVGGETRVLAVPRSIRFSEMKKKVEEMYKTEVAAIKYQLLAEDPDVLVSVTCDEDLAHMLEEYDRLEAKRSPSASPRFRVYVFPPATATALSAAANASSRHAGGARRHHFQLEPYVETMHGAVAASSRYLGLGPVSAGNSPRAIASEQAAAGLHRVRSTPNLGSLDGLQLCHQHTADGGSPGHSSGSPGHGGGCGFHLLQGHCHHQCCRYHHQYHHQHAPAPAHGPAPLRAGAAGRLGARGYARGGYYYPSLPPTARPGGAPGLTARGAPPFSETQAPRKATAMWY